MRFRIMKKIALTSFALLLISVSAYADQLYLSYLPDVPLMNGMAELPEQSLVFDKAEGRVIETAVFASVTNEPDVMAFYNKTLPSLGWQTLSSDRFLRNGEQLIVKCEKVSGGTIVRFSLSPKQG